MRYLPLLLVLVNSLACGERVVDTFSVSGETRVLRIESQNREAVELEIDRGIGAVRNDHSSISYWADGVPRALSSGDRITLWFKNGSLCVYGNVIHKQVTPVFGDAAVIERMARNETTTEDLIFSDLYCAR